jgi:anthranilate synthase component 2
LAKKDEARPGARAIVGVHASFYVTSMILVIDNYDSFTWNLVHYLRMAGAEVVVARNDSLGVDQAMRSGASAILLSPGPGRPEAAGISLGLVAACAEDKRPLLGVCLGHQAIALHFGAEVERSPRPMHGKSCSIDHSGSGIFEAVPTPIIVARYHSLTVRPESLPSCLAVTATAPDGTIQGITHRDLPIHGVQFHPESIASEYGHDLLTNFLMLSGTTSTGKVPTPRVA